MGGSIKLFSVSGIDIKMHLTFPLILIWGAIQFGVLNDGGIPGAIFGVIIFLLLFVIVIMHELGHSFTALRYGVPVKDIVMLPIGGVAQFARLPEEPKEEFMIAVAGPAVNFVLGLLLYGVAILFGLPLGLPTPDQLFTEMQALSFTSIFRYVFWVNLFIGVFNLLPAYPMDGGRVLRALLATRMQYLTATKIAVAIGQGTALLFGLIGFLTGDFILIIIAIFIYIGAGQESQQVALRHTLSGLTVGQAYSEESQSLSPEATLQDAVDIMLSAHQADFPICEGDRLVGFVTKQQLIDALEAHDAQTAVSHVMRTDLNPATPDDEIFEVQQRMVSEGLSAMPVVDGEKFLGVLTNTDVSELYRLVSIQRELIPNAGSSS